ncbi:MAG: hypothetical protein K8S25_15930 [Alphaproteobacteria bacterium]|nr:hypothetical protein [Alphaproteobacteria bacterium]
MNKTFIGLLLSLAAVAPAMAMFAMVPADRVDEVPIERLLGNIEANAQGLSPAQKWRAIGRLHLLAYLRQVSVLPVYRERPGDIAEGGIDDCAKLDEQSMGRGSRENFPPAKPGERCEARSYSLGPKREVPAGAETSSLPANAHLASAVEAYGRAKALEPGNLRTRLALAFALDRSGRKPLARNELRFNAREGLKQLPAPNSGNMADWELHVVLSETVEHFSRIVKWRSDKRLISILKARLDASPPAMYVTPIFVPLTAEVSFEALVDRASAVAFDFTGQGERVQAGWLKTKAAWLIWDPKARAQVTSGFQMFGSVTWVASWDNGFMALGALDDDGDGAISGRELDGVSLWHDANNNGISDAGEVLPVAAFDIVALDYAHERVDDERWVSATGVTFANGQTRPTYDWQLRRTLLVPVKN